MTTDATATAPDGVPISALDHLVVGIGASAGGLQALTRFFEGLPPDNGMAFVVVMHLSPDHESHAAEILQRSTRMPVRQVTAQVAIQPDHVYVIPPGQSLSMRDGHLLLAPLVRVSGVNVAIDTFFRLLAEEHGSRAVCIVLSGTGSDGSVGLQRIKEMGGVTLVQSPDDALHDGMPRSAISTGLADFVLPAAELPGQLVRLARNAGVMRMPRDVAPILGTDPVRTPDDALAAEAALGEIMLLLRSRTRHDFRHYKRPTVLRRLERRMQVTGVPTLMQYRDHLRDHADETPALLQDMLISVTNFFRDREAFDALERDVLPGLVARAGTERPLRAWVVGCASGEEAYSLAMLLQEATARAPLPAQAFQVFATDIDDRALGIARAGIYPGSIATDVVPSRLHSFFVPQQNRHRIAKGLRERVLFAHHNVLRDPPFSRVDLICCRNLLIYLDPSAQVAVLDAFRFSLNSGGVLFLGSSETADSVAGAFTALDKRNHLYRLRSPLAAPAGLRDRDDPVRPVATRPAGGQPSPSLGQTWADMHQRARLDHAMPSVLIDHQHRILHLSEGMAPFLGGAEGKPSSQLLDNLQPGLQLALRTALFQLGRQGGDGPRAISVDAESGGGRVVVMVLPLHDVVDGLDALMVRFQRAATPHPLPGEAPAGATAEQAVQELDSEVARLRQQLQDVIEHGESSTEELMSSNDELQALNEELRSATEELETGREELQSTNEELTTVNNELALKVDETNSANDDLTNLINANDIATLFVDSEMRIKRFTPRATELFNLIATDVGRPLEHVTHRLHYDLLADDARSAFTTLRLIEREVGAADGRQFIARVLPYRTAEDRIEGAILSFVDVSTLRAAEHEERAGAERLRLAVESTRDFAVLTADDDGHVTSWNRGAARLFGYTAEQIIGRPMALTFSDDDRAAGAPHRVLQTARDQGRSDDERWHKRADDSLFYCSDVVTRLEDGRGFAVVARDLTGSRQSTQTSARQLTQEQAGRRQAEATVASKEMFLAMMSHELKQPLNLIHLNAELLTRLPEIRALPAAARRPPDPANGAGAGAHHR